MVDMINGNIPDTEEKKIEEHCPLIKLTMAIITAWVQTFS